jgi:hypothetical protein
VSPALRLHLDSALVSPVHEQKIVRQVVRIHRAFAAKSKVSTSCHKPNLLLLSLTERLRPLRGGIAARGASELGAAVRRNRQCAGLGERSGGRREVFPLGFTGGIPSVWVQGAKLSCVGSRDEVPWSPRSGLSEACCCLAMCHISHMKPERARGANGLADSHSPLADWVYSLADWIVIVS